ITNPSARYRPDGSSGIINIVLKKNIKSGWNGSVTANAGNHERYNGNINLNYKKNKLNLFGSYSLRKDSRLRTTTIDRTLFDSIYHEDSHSRSRPFSQIGSLGADYSINEHNTFGVSGNFVNKTQVK